MTRIIMCGCNGKMGRVISQLVKEDENGGALPVPDYVDEIVSNKVVKLIQSYTGVVDKMVWRKF